jgi:NADH-quinone oxidoreductase subunit F
MKWQFAAGASSDKKYVICNADEGDPGAYMDRSVLESDPHSVLEGMAICAYAIGSDEGYVYCRAEYPLAVKRLNIAIAQAEERGLLGEGITGSGFNFTVRVKEGAGPSVCGEQHCRLLEGRRNIHVCARLSRHLGSVSSPQHQQRRDAANVGWILRNRAEAYSAIGSGAKDKVFAPVGKVKRSGGRSTVE